MKKTNADYDAASDSLSIHTTGSKSSFSVENGDVIIDFDVKKEIVGVEFLNASKMLSLIAKTPVTKEALMHIKNCSLAPTKTRNTLVISFALVLEDERVIENSITVPIMSGRKLIAIA